jgi:predicted DsbA family dithiol-disulfide isomerase
MVVTRQIERGAQIAAVSVGAPVHVRIRRVPYLLEPDYPDDVDFVESHQDRLARKFALEVGATGKHTWAELDATQRNELLQFVRRRKNCGGDADDITLGAVTPEQTVLTTTPKKADDGPLSLEERGKQVGISFLCKDDDVAEGERVHRRANTSTVASHRLVRWASRQCEGKSEAVFAAVNSKHFEEGRRLNDYSMLAEAAADAGLDPEAALEYLASDEDVIVVREEAAHARKVMKTSSLGCAIPLVVFEGNGGAMVGAQSPEVFARKFGQMILRRGDA